jgi:hypothetical protein
MVQRTVMQSTFFKARKDFVVVVVRVVGVVLMVENPLCKFLCGTRKEHGSKGVRSVNIQKSTRGAKAAGGGWHDSTDAERC